MDQVIVSMLAQGWTPGAVGIWLLVGMLGIYFMREWRETRKLSSADRQARREGYEKQVSTLLDENRKLGDDLRDLRDEYDRYRRLCQEETDQLRQEIRRMEFSISGMERQIKAQSSAIPRVIEDQLKITHTHDQEATNGSRQTQ